MSNSAKPNAPNSFHLVKDNEPCLTSSKIYGGFIKSFASAAAIAAPSYFSPLLSSCCCRPPRPLFLSLSFLSLADLLLLFACFSTLLGSGCLAGCSDETEEWCSALRPERFYSFFLAACSFESLPFCARITL